MLLVSSSSGPRPEQLMDPQAKDFCERKGGASPVTEFSGGWLGHGHSHPSHMQTDRVTCPGQGNVSRAVLGLSSQKPHQCWGHHVLTPCGYHRQLGTSRPPPEASEGLLCNAAQHCPLRTSKGEAFHICSVLPWPREA